MRLPDIVYVLPLLFVGLGAVSLMIISTFKKVSTRVGVYYTLFFLVLAFVANLVSINSFDEAYSFYPFVDVFKRMMVVDTYSDYFSIFLILGGILTMLIGVHYFENEKRFSVEFFSLFLFSLFGMMLLVHSNELITAYISLEIASISMYVMIGFEKVIEKRIEASYKYLVLGSLAGIFFILGASFIYASTQSTTVGDIGAFISQNINMDISLFFIGGTMILITFLFKIAAFPFHNWAIDVYDGAPLPVTAFMAATFKMAVFGFMLRLILIDFGSIRDTWYDILIYVIILTLVYGSFLAIVQKSLKRMLVSSSIVHTGYMLIAFVSVSALGESAASSIIFYLVAYFLSAIGAFGLISYISSDDHLRISYEDFRGFAHIRPYMAAMLSVFMLSLAGIPSTIGFIGKFYIFTGAIESGHTILAVFAILATFVSVYYYFKLIAVMYFYPSAEMKGDIPPLKGIAPIVIAIIALFIIWGGVGNTLVAYFPGVDFLIDTAKVAYKSLFLNCYLAQCL
jgi:NADH-quinone oxidoreductase subunit N